MALYERFGVVCKTNELRKFLVDFCVDSGFDTRHLANVMSNETIQMICQYIILIIQIISFIDALRKNAVSVNVEETKVANLFGIILSAVFITTLFWTAGAYSLIF